MNIQITQTNNNRFNVLVNADFYVYVDLDHSTAGDTSGTLKEAELDYIFNDVEKYSREMVGEKENPYEMYGVSESQFLRK